MTVQSIGINLKNIFKMSKNIQADLFDPVPNSPGFYNTINLSGQELKQAKENNLSKEERILDIFKKYGQPLTPFEVFMIYRKMYPEIPLTSVRRCITDLTQERQELIKLGKDKMKPGGLGSPNHTWIYNKDK